MNPKFGAFFCYKVIYIFEINAETHKGLLKVGDASLFTDSSIDSLSPNSKELNQAALARIKQYTNTAGLTPRLLHTELAVRAVKNADGSIEMKPFRDYDVHRVLVNSGIPKKQIKNTSGKEWFATDLLTVKKAIDAVKKGLPNFIGNTGEAYIPIVFRPEQEDAIAKTLKQFKTGKRMLWNAKMRFGKTLSALQVVKEAGYSQTIIITHRPVVDKGWYEDFSKIFHDGDGYIYGSKNTGADIDYLIGSGKKFVYFASIQDLRGSATVGGKFDKNDTVFSLDWDLVIVDEAHEGTTTVLGDDVIKKLVKDDGKHSTRFLALSGTPFNILKDYDDNIYTWDYVMEQRSKFDWDAEHFGDSNPYDELPELWIYTYDLGKIISEARYVELEDKVTWTSPNEGLLQTADGKGTFPIRKEATENYFVAVYIHGGLCYIERKNVAKHNEQIDEYKVLLPRSGNPYSTIIGKPILSEPGSCSSNTYAIAIPESGFGCEANAKNFISYCKTKFFRFLVATKSFTQMLSPDAYEFVPIQDFSKPWTDAELYEKYGLAQDEIDFIEATIKPME